MDMKIARKFAALVAKKKEAEAELKDAREAMAELEPLILQMLTDEGLKDLKLTVSGMSITLYPKTMLWAYPKEGDRGAVCKALKKARLGDLVKEDYNTSTLSAWARERLAEGVELPPTIASVVELTEKVTLQGRRTATSPQSKSAKAIETIRR
tara:strand:- start:1021 stop:1479 length:459 start_codon:yes stop_codon:yes gene_type:complete